MVEMIIYNITMDQYHLINFELWQFLSPFLFLVNIFSVLSVRSSQ